MLTSDAKVTDKPAKELFKFDSGLTLQPPPASAATPQTAMSGKVWEGPSAAEGEIDKLLNVLPVEGEVAPKIPEAILQAQVAAADPAAADPAAEDKPKDEAEEKKLYTEEDKYRFVQLSCAGRRFTKTYAFMQNAISVTFRELNPVEDSLIIRQIAADSFADERNGTYQGADAYFFSAEIYSMVASIAEFSRPGMPSLVFPEVMEALAKFEQPAGKIERHPFRELVAQIIAKIFPTTSIQRLALSRFREFRQMVLQLERHSLLENF